MAKKHHDLQDDGLDLPDLDEFDDLFDMDGQESQQSRLRRFTRGFRRGFLGGVTSRSSVSQILDKSLPDGYTALIDEGERFRYFARDLRDSVVRENASTLLSIANHAETNLEKIRGRISDSKYSRLESLIAKRKEELERQLGFNKTSGSEQEREQQALAEMFASIQASSSVQQEAKQEEDQTRERLEDGIRDQIEAGRFEVTHEILADIRNAQNRQVAYQDSVGHQVAKKGLELQFRSLFMLRDLKRLQGAQLALSRNGFEALVHNTSLPSHAKRKHAVSVLDSQQFGELIGSTGLDPDAGRHSMFRREHIGHALAMQGAMLAGTTLQDHLRTYGPQVRDNLLRAITSGLQSVDGSLSSAELASDLVGMGDRVETAGQVAGSVAGSYAMSRLAPKVGQFARPHLDRLNERLGGRNHQLAYLLSNAPSVIQDYVNDPDQSFGWRGALQSVARTIFPTFGLEGKLTDGDYHTIDQDSSFNHLTQRSIVEVIPGYLSRLLHEFRILRTGDESLEREVYDITSGRFTGLGTAKSKLTDAMFSPTMRQNVSQELDRIVATYDPDANLSDEARYALRERLMRDSATGGRFDPAKYLEWSGYDPTTSDVTLDELERHFRSRYDFDHEDRLVGDLENRRRRQVDSEEFLRLRSLIPDARETIQRVYSTGSQEVLRELGLITNELGHDRINFDNLWSHYRGVGERTPTEREEEAKGKGLGDFVKEGRSELKEWFTQNRPEDLERLERLKARARGTVEGLVSEAESKLEEHGVKARYQDARDATIRAGESLQERLRSGGKSLKERWEDRQSEHLGHLAGDTSDEARTRIMAEVRRRADSARRRSELDRLRTDLFSRENLRNPRLVFQKLKEGHYFDAETGRVLESYEDIKGRVVDRFGNTVIGVQDLAGGLVDSAGREVSSLRAHFDRFAESPGVQDVQTRVQPLFTRAKNRITETFENLKRDIYVEGEESPRVRISDLLKGKFFKKESGVQIWDPEEIDGAITTADGNEVLSEEEITKAVTIEGEEHPIRKKRGLISRLLRGAAKGYWNLTKRYYSWLGRKALGGAKTFFNIGRDQQGPEDDDRDEDGSSGPQAPKGSRLPRGLRWLRDPRREVNATAIETPTDGLLARVLGTLQTMAPEQHRRGSWQDIFSRRKAQEEASKEGGGSKDGSDVKRRDFMEDLMGLIPGAGILNSLKDLFGGPGGAVAAGAAGAAGGSLLSRTVRGLGRGAVGAAKGLGRGALWAGKRLAIPAAKVAGKGLLAGGSALVSALGWPVVLAGAAVVGVGAGGYYLWRRYQSRRGAIQRLRMAQYGFDPDSHRQVQAALAMEEEFIRNASIGPEGVTIDVNSLDMGAMLEAFGIEEDSEDEEHILAWSNWARNRFQPVLLAHLNAHNTYASSIDFHDLDDSIDAEAALDYLDHVVGVVGTEPYGYTQDPFGSDETLTGSATVAEYLTEAREEYQVDSARRSSVAANPVVAAQSGLTQDERRREQLAQANQDSTFQELGREAGRTLQAGGGGPRRLMDTTTAIGSTNVATGSWGTYSALQRLRLHTYGLDALDGTIPRALLTIEDELFSRMSFEGNEARYDISARAFFDEFGSMLGVTRQHRQYGKWAQWVQQRFIPVLLVYRTALRQVAPNARPANPEAQLDRFKRVAIARALITARMPRSEETVFESGLEFPGHSNETALQAAELLLRQLEDLERQDSESAEVDVQDRTGGGSGTQTNSGSLQEQTQRSANRRLHESASLDRYQYQPMGSGVRHDRGFVSGLGGGPGAQPYTGGAGVSFSGLEGTGGVWEEIPSPQAEGKEHAAPTIRAAGQMVGVPWEYLFALAGVESSWRFSASPSTSSAMGWYQFIEGTWTNNGRGVFDQHHATYGIPRPDNRQAVLALRREPRIAALMAGEFTKANERTLKAKLDKQLTFTDLYMAHFLGAGGAIKFLRALARDGSVLGHQAFPTEAQSNPWVFRPNGRSVTLAEIYEEFTRKIESHLPDGMSGSDFTSIDVPNPSSHDAPSLWDGEGHNAISQMYDGWEVEQVAPASEGPGAFRMTPGGGGTGAGGLSSLADVGRDPLTLGDTPIDTGVVDEEDSEGGIAEDPVTQARQNRERQQRLADVQQRSRTLDSGEETRAIGRIAEEQLAVQQQMRDHLQAIAMKFDLLNTQGLRMRTEEGDDSPSNDTSRPVPPTGGGGSSGGRQERQVGQTTPAISTASRASGLNRQLV